MRVFILSTGRSGTMTWARACSHIDNYTSAHESQPSKWRGRLDYPDGHIEVDHRITWFLGSVDKLYGDDPVYVDLRRDPDKVAESWAARWRHQPSQMHQFATVALYLPPKTLKPLSDAGELEVLARLMIDTVNDNIDLFLQDKTKVVEATIEDPHDGFDEMWDLIGAEGDRQAAHATLDRVHNERGRRRR